MTFDTYIPIGTIVKAHGVKGEVKVAPLGADVAVLSVLETIETVPLAFENCMPKDYTITSYKTQPKNCIVKLKGVDSIDDAEALRGAVVSVPKDVLPDPDEGAYYVYDLVGLDVVDEAGRCYGTVVGEFATKSNDVLEIETSNKEIVNIPFIEDIVKDVDVENKRLVIENLEGLFDESCSFES